MCQPSVAPRPAGKPDRVTYLGVVRPHQARCSASRRYKLPVAVLLEIDPPVLQSHEMPVMSTKTRTQPLDGIITTHVTLNMSIIGVCDLSMIFGIVCARRLQLFSESLFIIRLNTAKTAVYYNLGFICVSNASGSICYNNMLSRGSGGK